MSKIGKKNITIPKDSSIKIEGSNLTITGPKGSKCLTINDKIFSSKVENSEFQINPLEKGATTVQTIGGCGFCSGFRIIPCPSSFISVRSVDTVQYFPFKL